MARLLIVLVCSVACCTAQTVQPIAGPYYDRLIKRGEVVGACFAEVTRGQIVETSAFGKAHLDSLWRAASTSKALTAVGIMRLVERRQLDLDVDVNEYLKTWKVPATKSKPITLRQLLTHTSGLDDPFVGSGFLADAGTQSSLAAVMQKWLPTRLYKPGEVRLYTNFGYGLVGAVIEEATGKRYEDFMRSEVLEPLGMTHSTFQQPLPEELAQNLVPSIERTALGFTHPAEIIYHRAASAGGLTTTLADLIRFVQFVQGKGSIDGRAILRSETLDLMLGESPNLAGESEGYGFSNGINRGQKYWYAGGDLGGYHTILLWFPYHQRALITMATSGSYMATWNLVADVMPSWFGVNNKSAAVASHPIPNALAFAMRVSGTYRPVRYPHGDIGKTFLVTMDQQVRANPDGSISYGGERWIAIGPLRFRNVADGRQLTFEADSSGKIRFMNAESERIAWFESGRAAIALYFCFIGMSMLSLWRSRHSKNDRPVRWMAAAIMIHSVSWLGAILIADPQRLILGCPWYLKFALVFGTVVPLVWVYLFVSTCWGMATKRFASANVPGAMLMTLALGLYLPFIGYWQLTALPLLTAFFNHRS